MSVLCCRVPNFLYQNACLLDASLQDRPAVLLGPDDTVWGISPEAHAVGLMVGMLPHQVRARCPEAQLHPLDLPAMQAAQHAWIGYLTEWGLPTEPVDWGAAYVDLHPITHDKNEVRGIAGKLGCRMRLALGETLQPALGWDSGKFTARAAALRTRPGHMKLVDAVDEKRFLAPLPIRLLPLAPANLQQLDWLGIHTIGAFAALPEAAVWQRFGKTGKLALRLARGKDERPVRSLQTHTGETLALSWDPPTQLLPPVLAALEKTLQPTLDGLGAALQGCLGLSMRLGFTDGASCMATIRLMQPTTDRQKLFWRIQHELTLINWPDALATLEVTLEAGELPIQQLSLFSSAGESQKNITELAGMFTARYGSIFFATSLLETGHPIPERRSKRTVMR